MGGMLLGERVGSMDARMHYVCTKSCPECSVHMLYLYRKVCMAAPRGSLGTCNVSVSREWDGHGRSVSRSMHVVP